MRKTVARPNKMDNTFLAIIFRKFWWFLRNFRVFEGILPQKQGCTKFLARLCIPGGIFSMILRVIKLSWNVNNHITLTRRRVTRRGIELRFGPNYGNDQRGTLPIIYMIGKQTDYY